MPVPFGVLVTVAHAGLVAEGDGEDLEAMSEAALIDSIKAEHAAIEGSVRRSLEHARRAGQLLIEARHRLPHGGWMKWLRKNVGFSYRTAAGYMRLAYRWPELNAKVATVATLGLREALVLLTRRKRDVKRHEDQHDLFRERDHHRRRRRRGVETMYRCPMCGHGWCGDPWPDKPRPQRKRRANWAFLLPLICADDDPAARAAAVPIKWPATTRHRP